MGSYSHKIFRCPFYSGDIREEKTRKPVLFCEDGSKLRFPDYPAFNSFADGLCCAEEWRSCPMARVRSDFYDRREAKKRDCTD